MTADLRETLAFALNIALRRWRTIAVAVLAIVVIGYIALKLSPITYVSRALLLIQSANRPASVSMANSSINRRTVLDQLAALEAWLKSDEVLGNLLPKLVDQKLLASPEALATQMKLYRKRLEIDLVGNAAVEVRLEGKSPQGLGGQLEIVIQRLMEGLLRPERGVLNAQQFIDVHQREALAAADAALTRAIASGGLVDTDALRSLLNQINELKIQYLARSSQENGVARSLQFEQNLQTLRSQISENMKMVFQLELLYAEYHLARTQAHSGRENLPMSRSNYVGIFESPENLLLVGRPQDPIYGERAAMKIIMGLVALSVLLAVAISVGCELLAGRVVTRKQFEAVTGLPVITRLPA
jgi:uncharacterized protein involved in exopolysaccharide biosynthesis